MRVITRRATMLAGDRSQSEISPASILSDSRDYLNFVHWCIWYTILCDFGAFTSFSAYTRIQLIYEKFSNRIFGNRKLQN